MNPDFVKHARIPKAWLILVVGIVVAAHAFLLYRISSNLAWSVLIGLAVLVILKHVGLLGSLYAVLKRRSRTSR